MGFAAGLKAGTSVGNSWIKNYKTFKEERLTDGITKAATDLMAQKAELDAEGNAIQQEAMDFVNMNPAELTNKILEQASANGMKISDEMYRMAYGIGETLQQKQQQVSLFKEKERVLEERANSLAALAAKRARVNTARAKAVASVTGDVPAKKSILSRYDKRMNAADPEALSLASTSYAKSHGGEPATSSKLLSPYLTQANKRVAERAVMENSKVPKKKSKEVSRPSTKPEGTIATDKSGQKWITINKEWKQIK